LFRFIYFRVQTNHFNNYFWTTEPMQLNLHVCYWQHWDITGVSTDKNACTFFSYWFCMKHWPLDVKPPINYRLKYKLEYHSNEILGLQIDNISAVSFNLKFMCMMLKNRDKSEFHRAFPQLCAECKYILYFQTLH
jgi:hypothetical protein